MRRSSSWKRRSSRPNGTELTIGLAQNHGGWNSDDLMTNNLGRFRVSVTGDPVDQGRPLAALVRQALAIPRDRRSPEQVETIFGYWRTLVPEWKAENERIEALWKTIPPGRPPWSSSQRTR